MRARGRKQQREEEEESAFVSMTDMTVGFLFVVMILLAFFASQFKDAQVDTNPAEIARLKAEIAELKKQKTDPIELYMSNVDKARRQILEQLRDGLKIDFPDLHIQLNEQSDALRFQGDGLFVQGQSTFLPGKEAVMKRVAQRLNEILPCYTFGGDVKNYASCNPYAAVIEAVQIEGHTDSTGTYPFNISLSADRATTTFELMIDTVPALRMYKNLNAQTVISFAGYGPDRPVASNDTSAGQATNRRIDLRFIMVTPQSSDQIRQIRDKFSSLVVATP